VAVSDAGEVAGNPDKILAVARLGVLDDNPAGSNQRPAVGRPAQLDELDGTPTQADQQSDAPERPAENKSAELPLVNFHLPKFLMEVRPALVRLRFPDLYRSWFP
jgi:hypothetical protein